MRYPKRALDELDQCDNCRREAARKVRTGIGFAVMGLSGLLFGIGYLASALLAFILGLAILSMVVDP